ncbi:SNF2-related domain-containing protein [Tieghemostelium lacteum]|uniref:SNF2-related domain-containing protein n=1 Tax=Tieghemostelium lacteum TaxID=361077 RepID=A0A151Z5D9_TIELA|nr:SNF2-related domain-containing protein [Tieghemostelium lacteum]|eukprot:KYQ89182.1 SNF2-related domain-containing protein [Tieghemostelium lacteum]
MEGSIILQVPEFKISVPTLSPILSGTLKSSHFNTFQTNLHFLLKSLKDVMFDIQEDLKITSSHLPPSTNVKPSITPNNNKTTTTKELDFFFKQFNEYLFNLQDTFNKVNYHLINSSNLPIITNATTNGQLPDYLSQSLSPNGFKKETTSTSSSNGSQSPTTYHTPYLNFCSPTLENSNNNKENTSLQPQPQPQLPQQKIIQQQQPPKDIQFQQQQQQQQNQKQQVVSNNNIKKNEVEKSSCTTSTDTSPKLNLVDSNEQNKPKIRTVDFKTPSMTESDSCLTYSESLYCESEPEFDYDEIQESFFQSSLSQTISNSINKNKVSLSSSTTQLTKSQFSDDFSSVSSLCDSTLSVTSPPQQGTVSLNNSQQQQPDKPEQQQQQQQQQPDKPDQQQQQPQPLPQLSQPEKLQPQQQIVPVNDDTPKTKEDESIKLMATSPTPSESILSSTVICEMKLGELGISCQTAMLNIALQRVRANNIDVENIHGHNPKTRMVTSFFKRKKGQLPQQPQEPQLLLPHQQIQLQKQQQEQEQQEQQQTARPKSQSQPPPNTNNGTSSNNNNNNNTSSKTTDNANSNSTESKKNPNPKPVYPKLPPYELDIVMQSASFNTPNYLDEETGGATNNQPMSKAQYQQHQKQLNREKSEFAIDRGQEKTIKEEIEDLANMYFNTKKPTLIPPPVEQPPPLPPSNNNLKSKETKVVVFEKPPANNNSKFVFVKEIILPPLIQFDLDNDDDEDYDDIGFDKKHTIKSSKSHTASKKANTHKHKPKNTKNIRFNTNSNSSANDNSLQSDNTNSSKVNNPSDSIANDELLDMENDNDIIINRNQTDSIECDNNNNNNNNNKAIEKQSNGNSSSTSSTSSSTSNDVVVGGGGGSQPVFSNLPSNSNKAPMVSHKKSQSTGVVQNKSRWSNGKLTTIHVFVPTSPHPSRLEICIDEDTSVEKVIIEVLEVCIKERKKLQKQLYVKQNRHIISATTSSHGGHSPPTSTDSSSSLSSSESESSTSSLKTISPDNSSKSQESLGFPFLANPNHRAFLLRIANEYGDIDGDFPELVRNSEIKKLKTDCFCLQKNPRFSEVITDVGVCGSKAQPQTGAPKIFRVYIQASNNPNDTQKRSALQGGVRDSIAVPYTDDSTLKTIKQYVCKKEKFSEELCVFMSMNGEVIHNENITLSELEPGATGVKLVHDNFKNHLPKSNSFIAESGNAPRPITKLLGPMFFFTPDTAGEYKQYLISKVNKFGVRKERCMAIDRDRILYSINPSSASSTTSANSSNIPGSNASNTTPTKPKKSPFKKITSSKLKTSLTSISDICSVGNIIHKPSYFFIKTDQGKCTEYFSADSEEIVAKLNFLIKELKAVRQQKK